MNAAQGFMSGMTPYNGWNNGFPQQQPPQYNFGGQPQYGNGWNNGFPQQGFPSQAQFRYAGPQQFAIGGGGFQGFGAIDQSLGNIQGLNDNAFALLNGVGPNEQALYNQGIDPNAGYGDPYGGSGYGYDDPYASYSGGWGQDQWGGDPYGDPYGSSYGYDDPYASYGGGWGDYYG